MCGRNKIQDFWAPTVYKVVQVPATDGAPRSLHRVEKADWTGDSKRIERTEIQPCPDTMMQPTKQAQTVFRHKIQTWKEDSSADSDEEDSLLFWGQITDAPAQDNIAQPSVDVAADVSLEQPTTNHILLPNSMSHIPSLVSRNGSPVSMMSCQKIPAEQTVNQQDNTK